ncbi:hypothetical protein LTR95_014557 [Oleoguttula sp. CCFEE 5521]
MPPGMAGLNLSAMPGFNTQQPFAPAQQAQAPPSGGATDIQALLKTLAANGLMAPQPPASQPLAAPPIQMPTFPGFPMPQNFTPPPPNLPKLPNGEPDLAAILATLNASSPQPQPPPNFSGFPIYQPPPAGMSVGEGKNDGAKHPFYKTKIKKARHSSEKVEKKPKKAVEELRCSHCVGHGLGTKGESCKHKRHELKLIKEAEMMRRYMKSMRHKLWVQRKGFVCRCDICDPDEDEEN